LKVNGAIAAKAAVEDAATTIRDAKLRVANVLNRPNGRFFVDAVCI